MKNKETLEEVAEKRYPFEDGFQVMDIDISEMLQLAFINGAKWQQEQDKNKYSEKEVMDLLNNLRLDTYSNSMGRVEFLEWFEEFKKK